MDDIEEGAALIETLRAGDETPAEVTEEETPAEATEPDNNQTAEAEDSPEPEVEAQPDSQEAQTNQPEEPVEEAAAEEDEPKEASAPEEPESRKLSTHQRTKKKLAYKDEQITHLDGQLSEIRKENETWSEVAHGYRGDAQYWQTRAEQAEATLTKDYGHEEPESNRRLQDLEREYSEYKLNVEMRQESNKKQAEAQQNQATDFEARRILEETAELSEKYEVPQKKILLYAQLAQGEKFTFEEIAKDLSSKNVTPARKEQLTKNRTAPKPIGDRGRAKTPDYENSVDGATEFILARRAGHI